MKVATSPGTTLESVSHHLSANIKGQDRKFEDAAFGKVADIDRVRKVYKLNSATPTGKLEKVVNGASGANSSKPIDEVKVMETQILGLMALRGAT